MSEGNLEKQNLRETKSNALTALDFFVSEKNSKRKKS